MILGTSNNFTFYGSWPLLFMTILLQKIQEKIWNHLRKSLSFHNSTFWNSKILTFFGPINLPQKIASSKRIFGVFPLNNFRSSIILTKWKIIRNIFQRATYGLYEPGMLWNLDILAYFPKQILWLIGFSVFFGGRILNHP